MEKSSFFCPNVGQTDRILRIAVGVILIALVFVGPQTPWGWIGIVPIATALMGFCPLYPLLKINTCGGKEGGCCGGKPSCCGGKGGDEPHAH